MYRYSCKAIIIQRIFILHICWHSLFNGVKSFCTSWRWIPSLCCVRSPPRHTRRTFGYTPPTCGWLFSPSVSMPHSLASRTSPCQTSTACEPCLRAVFRPFSCSVPVRLSFDILFTVGTLTFCDRREQNSSALMVERGVLGFPKQNLAPSSEHVSWYFRLSALHVQGHRP